MRDSISKADVLEAFADLYDVFEDNKGICIELDKVFEKLNGLKEQDAKTGTWIEKTDYMGDTYYDCSVCGESWTTIDGTPWQNGMNYCPHCGAKMET